MYHTVDKMVRLTQLVGHVYLDKSVSLPPAISVPINQNNAFRLLIHHVTRMILSYSQTFCNHQELCDHEACEKCKVQKKG